MTKESETQNDMNDIANLDQHPSPVMQLSAHRSTNANTVFTNSRSEMFSLPDRNGEIIFTGELLGHASSRVERHIGHGADAHAPTGVKCKACRWTETHIFRVTEDTHMTSAERQANFRYLIHTMGPSIVPHEFNKCRTEWASTGHEVIELLTVRTSKATYLPAPSARALAQAAGRDRAIEEAYVNRAVI